MPKDYLRNRPFFLMRQTTSPNAGVNTGVKGWMNSPNSTTTYESISIVDSVSKKHMIDSTLIIDVMNQTIVKSTYGYDDEKSVVFHYLDKYKSQISEAVTVWMEKLAKTADKTKLQELLAGFEDKIAQDAESK